MTQTEYSPLARLVLFMVCLSVAGTLLAGGHYFAVDLPQQQSVQVPSNGNTLSEILGPAICKTKCQDDDDECFRECNED